MAKEARGQTNKGEIRRRKNKHRNITSAQKEQMPKVLKNKSKTQITVRDIAQKENQLDLLVYIKTDSGVITDNRGSSQ